MRNPIQKWNNEVNARPQNRQKPPKPFYNKFLALRHDSDAQKDTKKYEGRKSQ
jgi:hypothetical protein